MIALSRSSRLGWGMNGIRGINKIPWNQLAWLMSNQLICNNSLLQRSSITALPWERTCCQNTLCVTFRLFIRFGFCFVMQVIFVSCVVYSMPLYWSYIFAFVNHLISDKLLCYTFPQMQVCKSNATRHVSPWAPGTCKWSNGLNFK